MTLDQVVRIVQVCYPQIYLTCHTRHQRKRSTEHHLSQRDSTVLAHLSDSRWTQPSSLAAHLRVTRSTVSECLKRLEQLGFVVARTSRPGRMTGAQLTPRGVRAVRDTSVLETSRLEAVLATASAKDRKIIGEGIARLAALCQPQSPDDTDE